MPIPIGPSKPGYVQGTANTVRDPNFIGPVQPVNPIQRSVLGANSIGGGSQIVPSSNLTQQLTDNARSGNSATIQAIQNRLNETRRQADQQISNATGARDYLTDFINKRYPELQGRVEQQRSNTIEDLGKQQTDLTNLYEKANAQARRRSESAALNNRMAARAGNRLGSSFYDQIVQDNQEGLGRTLGESDLERIGKIADIGTQRTRSNQEYDNTINDLDTQKNQAVYQAQDQYNKAVQAADALSRAGVLDFGEAEAQAAQGLQSRLDQIAQWAQGIQATQQNLSSQYSTGGAFDTGLSGLASGNQQFLTRNAVTPQANALQAYTPEGLTLNSGSGTDLANVLSLAGNQKQLTLDDILKGVSSGGLTL